MVKFCPVGFYGKIPKVRKLEKGQIKEVLLKREVSLPWKPLERNLNFGIMPQIKKPINLPIPWVNGKSLKGL